MGKVERLTSKTDSFQDALAAVINEERFNDLSASEIIGVFEIMKFSIMENLEFQEG